MSITVYYIWEVLRSMVYLFEDKESDWNSELFLASYSNTARNKMHFVNGASKLYDEASKWLLSDDVAVYIDMIPDNEFCSDYYRKLKDLVDRQVISTTHKLFVFTIVCSEYYILKYISKHTKLMESQVNLDICLNKEDYRKSLLYISNPGSCKNFEKFCKYVLIHDVQDCARHSRRREDGSCNTEAGNLYTRDCINGSKSKFCENISLLDKSLGLLMQYDCVPGGSMTLNKQEKSFKDADAIHKKLVDEYNAFVLKYYNLGMNVKLSRKGNISVYVDYIHNYASGGVK